MISMPDLENGPQPIRARVLLNLFSNFTMYLLAINFVMTCNKMNMYPVCKCIIHNTVAIKQKGAVWSPY